MKNASSYFARIATPSINAEQVRRTERAQRQRSTASTKLQTLVFGPGGILMSFADAMAYDLG